MKNTAATRARLAAVAIAAAAMAGCGKKPELHIYTWSDYISPDLVEAFEQKHGCRVVVDTFDSNETMYAKLKAGGAGYDIITPSSYLVALMAKEGLVAELEHSRMPNVRLNFDPSFSNQILDPDFRYNVPYAVTYTGLCYAKDKIPEGVEIDTWGVLANPEFKGKITLLDDIREVIGAGLMYCGRSLNSVDPAEIEEAVAQVVMWKQNIRKFDSESYKNEVPSGATWIGQGYSTDVTQVILGDADEGVEARDDIGFALPREGFSIAFDEMVLSATAPNPDLAYAFMDFLYEGENAKANMEYILGPVPVKPAIDALDEEFRSRIVLDAETLAHGQVIRAIDTIPGAMDLYNKAWDRIKAAGAR